jgi:hypothetical protein
MTLHTLKKSLEDRHHFIGGSDARTIMKDDEAALLRLWREKRARSNRKISPTS